MRRHKLLSLFITLLAVSAQLGAQTVTSSPYSRFGIGEYTNKILTQSAALGGTHVALRSDTLLPLFLNPANPASYSDVKITTFEAGVNTIFNKFSTNAASSQSNNTTLNYIALGFPIGKMMGACIGVMPSSNVGYTIRHSSSVENIGTVQELYEGDGGINQLYGGFSVMPFQKAVKNLNLTPDSGKTINKDKLLFRARWLSTLSIGANANYHFGTINTSSKVLFPSATMYFNTAQTTQSVVRGLSANFGILSTLTIDHLNKTKKDTVQGSETFGQKMTYRKNLKDHVQLTFGYTFSLNNDLNTKYTNFAYTFLYQSNGINEYVRDTVQLLNEVKAPLTLPAMHGIGIAIRKGTKLNILADFETQLWSGFSYIGESSALQDMKRVSLGIEYIPNKLTNLKAEKWKRIQFRAGAHYSDGNLLINNSRVNEVGVSLGLGLPVANGRGFFNTFNISSEFSQLGTTDNNLVKQQYIRVKLGFTFNDRWFQKYKYD